MKHKALSSLVCLAFLLGPVQPVQAADAVVGNGTPASCTEAAFNSALATVQTSAGGTITFSCGGTYTLTFAVQKTINKDVTVQGDSLITLDGNSVTRLFEVALGGKLTLLNITLSNGNSGAGDGGAVYNQGTLSLINTSILSNRTDLDHKGGGVASLGPVTVTGSVLSGNSAGAGGGLALLGAAADTQISSTSFTSNWAYNNIFGSGGGILNEAATLTLDNVLLQSNQSPFAGTAGIHNGADMTLTGTTLAGNSGRLAGGLYNSGSATLSDTLLRNNEASLGNAGGIFNTGTLSGENVTIAGNRALRGGGITNNSGSLTLSKATISGNTGTHSAGGMRIIGGDVTLTNVTISGNSSDSGGGIENLGTLSLTNVTFYGNSTGTFPMSAGGLQNNLMGVVTMKNVILSKGASGPNCAGSITSLGHNLSSDGSCPLASAGDLNNTNPNLWPLMPNGGFTSTHLPAAGSPAINAGDSSGAPTTDQRGRPRPAEGGVDIGAVERQAQDIRLIFLPVVSR